MSQNEVKVVFIGEDQGLGNMLGGLQNALGGVMQVAGGILSAQIFTNIGNQIKNMAIQGFEAVKGAEQLQMQLESLVAVELKNSGAAGNMTEAYSMATDKAEELHGWIKKLAAISPFDTDQVQKAFAQAMTYGLTSEEAKKLTESTLNWGAATLRTNAEVQDFMFVLSQMNSVGDVTAMDLKQLASRGLDLNLVAKELGVTVADLDKASPKDLISAFEAISSSTYAGGLERASMTLGGIVGFFEEFKNDALKTVFTDAIETIKPKLLELENFLMSDTFSEGLKNFGEGLGNFVSATIDVASNIGTIILSLSSGDYDTAFAGLNKIFGPEMSTDIINFSKNISDVETSINNVINFAKSLSTVEGRTMLLYDIFGVENTNNLIKTIDDIKYAFETTWPKIQSAFERAWEVIKPKWDEFVSNLNSGSFDSLITTISFLPTAIEVLSAAVIGIIGVITSIVTPLLATFDEYKKSLDIFMANMNLFFAGLELLFKGFSELITGIMTGDVEKIVEGLAKMGLGFEITITSILKTFVDGVKSTYELIKSFLVEQLDAFGKFFFGESIKLGDTFINGLINGLLGGMPNLISSIENILDIFKSADSKTSINTPSYNGGGVSTYYTPIGNGNGSYTNSSNINNSRSNNVNINIGNFSGSEQDYARLQKIIYQTANDNGY